MKQPKDGSIVNFQRRHLPAQARISYRILIDGKHVDYLLVHLQLASEGNMRLILEGRLNGDGQCTTDKYIVREINPDDAGAIEQEAECFTLLEALQTFHQFVHDKQPAPSSESDETQAQEGQGDD
jgi:hypothetical protein